MPMSRPSISVRPECNTQPLRRDPSVAAAEPMNNVFFSYPGAGEKDEPAYASVADPRRSAQPRTETGGRRSARPGTVRPSAARRTTATAAQCRHVRPRSLAHAPACNSHRCSCGYMLRTAPTPHARCSARSDADGAVLILQAAPPAAGPSPASARRRPVTAWRPPTAWRPRLRARSTRRRAGWSARGAGRARPDPQDHSDRRVPPGTASRQSGA
jgi:hypothetical protein